MASDDIKRILIVEDDANIALSLEFLMAQQGYEVAIASDGDTALAMASTFMPHLVLLDIMLPNRNGFDVCQALRASAAHAGLRIIMLTARGREEEAAKGCALGADRYITKPFATHELLDTAHRLLGAA